MKNSELHPNFESLTRSRPRGSSRPGGLQLQIQRDNRKVLCQSAAVKLPNASQLIVERDKILEYLLNSIHRYGSAKERFFTAFGFRTDDWEILAEALREHGRTHEIVRMHETRFGPRYVVEGELNTPVGRRPRVRSVWQFDSGTIAPRLITAYPLEDS